MKIRHLVFVSILICAIFLGCICAGAANYRTSYADKDGDGSIGVSDVLVQINNLLDGECRLSSVIKLLKRAISE